MEEYPALPLDSRDLRKSNGQTTWPFKQYSPCANSYPWRFHPKISKAWIRKLEEAGWCRCAAVGRGTINQVTWTSNISSRTTIAVPKRTNLSCVAATWTETGARFQGGLQYWPILADKSLRFMRLGSEAYHVHLSHPLTIDDLPNLPSFPSFQVPVPAGPALRPDVRRAKQHGAKANQCTCHVLPLEGSKHLFHGRVFLAWHGTIARWLGLQRHMAWSQLNEVHWIQYDSVRSRLLLQASLVSPVGYRCMGINFSMTGLRLTKLATPYVPAVLRTEIGPHNHKAWPSWTWSKTILAI